MVVDGTPRPANTAAHHIVGDTSKGAQPARDILKKHGIDVDEALSGIKHNGRHPNDYIEAVNERIIRADKEGGKQGVIDTLSEIREILSSASRNAKWKTIL
ncbi:AHH domain-containing protein [Proteus mirabilis]|uniref:AHH domain-containing protein n=1 Tax=Proteus mirabilis TaxID=584 RepID=UPI0023615308|nr:AHH domain-containing protein [Proteus mirabilis]MDC9753476.1 AHH domain-containing protein [Proteus mirabilis]